MGKPVPIMDLAHRMIQLSGGRVGIDIDIKVTGMRPGEKLEEDLREPDEDVLVTEHPSIARLLPVTPPKDWFDSCLVQLSEATHRGDDERVRELLFLSASWIDENDGTTHASVSSNGNAASVHMQHLQKKSLEHHRPEPAGT